MITLRKDSRDAQFHMKFGQVSVFPDELNFDTQLPDEVQPIGDIKCTCYSAVNIAEDQDNKLYDIDDLANRITFSKEGADPRLALGEAVENGLLPKGQTLRIKNWTSYWRCDIF